MCDIELNEIEAEDEPCMASADDQEFTQSLPSAAATPATSRVFRQQSLGARANQAAQARWRQIKKVMVEDRSQTKKDVTDKWVNLTRSMSNGVAEFFGTSENMEKDKWKTRARHLHGNSLLGGEKKKNVATGIETATATASITSPRFSFLPPSNETLDDVDSMTTLAKWNKKTAFPIDPLSRMHSRQLSRISTTSSNRRATRLQPDRKLQKDSVFKMAVDGVKVLSLGIGTTEEPKTFVRSRSFAPSLRQTHGTVDEPYLDDVFFDAALATSAVIRVKPFFGNLPSIRENDDKLPSIRENDIIGWAEPSTPSDAVFNSLDTLDGIQPWSIGPSFSSKETPSEDSAAAVATAAAAAATAAVQPTERVFSGMKRMADHLVDTVLVNADRRQYGVGAVGLCLDREYKQSKLDKTIQEQIDSMQDHRPYFTYWVTFVQIIIFIFTIAVYDFWYIGFDVKRIEEEVTRTNLAKELCSYFEQENLWIGPRQADLIHLGAKYSPCMRKDSNVEMELKKQKEIEKESACCIMNDGSGCFQASEMECSQTLSTWNKTQFMVCGQDQRFCTSPKSVWSKDDITLWPICTESKNATKSKEYRHMTCDIVGRPCCVGIQGQCIITTDDHCKFIHGYFHPEATLCSQVPCLNEICGMIPFFNSTIPDQFYRLWTSLFLHAGLIQLVITICFQVFVMRDLEKLAGWIRITFIYILSGIAGSLSSAIFLPYHVEAGPTGSQFGVLACLFVEVIQSWRLLARPVLALLKLLFLLFFLFIVGLFPWIDNYAHLIGFIIGFLLSFALFPHVDFNVVDKRGKRIGIVVCLIVSIGLFVGLVILFYVVPIYECKACKFFNCIPFSDTFCKSMEVEIKFETYAC